MFQVIPKSVLSKISTYFQVSRAQKRKMRLSSDFRHLFGPPQDATAVAVGAGSQEHPTPAHHQGPKGHQLDPGASSRHHAPSAQQLAFDPGSVSQVLQQKLLARRHFGRRTTRLLIAVLSIFVITELPQVN